LRNLSNDDLFFVTEEGNPVGHDNFQRRFQKDLELWGGKAIRFHDLRHTAATLLISSGIDLRTVQEIFGHEDITTTMNYTHLIGDNIKKVADLFSITG
jgi:integrase